MSPCVLTPPTPVNCAKIILDAAPVRNPVPAVLTLPFTAALKDGFGADCSGVPASVLRNGGAVTNFTQVGSVLTFAPWSHTRTGAPRAVDATHLQLTDNAGTDLTAATLSSLYRTDWQGTQLLYPTARTNLLLWSGDQTNVIWRTSNVTKTGGSTDPLAGTTAVTITATAANGYTFQNVSVPNVIYCNSIWVRRRTGAGTVKLFNPNQLPTPLALTGAWQRFSAYGLPISGTTLQLGVQITTIGDAVDIAFAQAEIGTTPSSYIPTTTAAVTVTDYTLSGATVTLANGGGSFSGTWTYSGGLESGDAVGVNW